MAFLFLFWLGCAIALVLKMASAWSPAKKSVSLDPKPLTYTEAQTMPSPHGPEGRFVDLEEGDKTSRFSLIEGRRP